MKYLENVNIDKRLLLILDEHISNVFYAFIKMYGEESFQICNQIAFLIAKRVPNITSNDPNIFKRRLKEETRNIINDKIKNKELNILNFTENFKLYESLNDLEKKIFIIGIPYALAGYKEEDAYQAKEQIKEICEKLNISELRCISSLTHIAYKVIRYEKETSNVKKKI